MFVHHGQARSLRAQRVFANIMKQSRNSPSAHVERSKAESKHRDCSRIHTLRLRTSGVTLKVNGIFETASSQRMPG